MLFLFIGNKEVKFEKEILFKRSVLDFVFYCLVSGKLVDVNYNRKCYD